MEWFRFYHEVLDDPKVQQLSPAMFKHWVNLLCLANQNSPRGTLPSVNDIAYRLRITRPKAAEIVDDLVRRDLVNRDSVTLHPHNWSARQRVSDDVAIRVAKHRSNVTGNVTCNADVTVTRDRDRTDTDTEQKQSPPVVPQGDAIKPDPKPKRSKPVLTDLPADFSVTAAMRQWAAERKQLNAAQVEQRTEHFLNYVAKTGKQYADWVAAWRDAMGWEPRSQPTNGRAISNGRNGTYSANDLAAMSRNEDGDEQSRDDEATLNPVFRLVK